MYLVIALSVLCFLSGLANGVSRLRSMRSQIHPQAEATWTQPPLSPWQYETKTMVGLSLHTIGLLCLTGVILYSAFGKEILPFPVKINFNLMVAALLWFTVAFVTYASGVVVSYHFAQPWISPVSYGIASGGMWYGGSLIKWKTFSHYEIGPDEGLISLYSSYSPSLRTWVLRPPAESFSLVLGLIQRNLPARPMHEEAFSWWHSPFVMTLEMAGLILVTFLATALGWIISPSSVWIYASLGFMFLQHTGIKLMTRFDGREHTKSTK